MKNDNARRILDDERYKQSKKDILESLAEAKNKLTDISPPHQELQSSYSDLLHEMNYLRGNPLYYPYLGSGLGNGLFVELGDGSIKYDLICGIGTHFFGHNFLPLTDVLIDAAVEDTLMQSNLQPNQDSVHLLEMLVKASGMDHGFLTTSGAMANENALKIVLQKNHPKTRIIAFENCFMGRTLVLSQITDKAIFKVGLPKLMPIDYLPFYKVSDHKGSIEQTKKALHQLLLRYPKQHAVICIEAVQGENGFYAGDAEFFSTICEMCKQEGIAVLVDEVQTFARTPRLFAFHHFQMQKYVDVVTVGKVLQTAVTLWKSEYNPKPLLLSQTFSAPTAAIKAAIFTLDYIQKNNLYGPEGKIEALHQTFAKELHKINQKYPGMCEGPYGIGAMIAFTPFQGDHAKVNAFAKKLFDNGVIGFIAGTSPVRIRFLIPPAIITENDIQKICAIIEQTIQENI